MENIRIFHLKVFVFFGGKILNIFELACFHNDCTEPFVITLPSSLYDFNIVERDVKHQIIIISSTKVLIYVSYFSRNMYVVGTHLASLFH